VRALDGVDFSLLLSELVVLLGASGSGKSTLLNILGGVDTPMCGSVCFGQRALDLASDEELTEYRRRHVVSSFSSTI
jgi:putative ABC transport system ATP-binding protein